MDYLDSGTAGGSGKAAVWARVGRAWVVNLDGSDAGQWSLPRIQVMESAPSHWCFVFVQGGHTVVTRTGRFGSDEEARDAAAVEALGLFPEWRSVIVRLLSGRER